MAKFDLKYGHTSFSYEVEDSRIVEVVNGNTYPAIEDIEQGLIDSLNNPIGTAPLKEIVKKGEKVCIVVSDITRAWIHYERFLPVLLDYLNEAGIPDEDMFFLIAYGAHRIQTDEESKMMFGEEVVRRVRIEHSTGLNKEDFTTIGTTEAGVPIGLNTKALEADRLILTGGLTYHLMAGYGAGRKAVLPGIASYESIQGNHTFCLADEVGGGTNPASASGKIEGNKMHEDQLDFAEAVGADFLINVINNAEGKTARFASGHWYDAWLDGTKTVDQIFGVPVKGLADVVIASAGGYPKDINLYQGVKTVDNARMAAKPGGCVILLIECEDITEPPDFMQWFDYKTQYDREVALRKAFTVPGFIALRMGEYVRDYNCILVTKKENMEIVAKTGLTAATTLDEALALVKEKLGRDDYSVTVMPLASSTMPIIK